MEQVTRNILIILFAVYISYTNTFSQYAPGVGQIGCSAIYKDNLIFVDWANSCIVNRGYIDIEDTSKSDTQFGTTSNKAFYGPDSLALGKAAGNLDVVSLGDGGSAILSFSASIFNGVGADFAVFENGYPSLSSYFLELAFVEVSSDGVNFIRFPSVSLTQSSTQTNGFGVLDPTKIHNLAGKYEVNYGTPFDLNDLVDSAFIDINNINYVKIIDVRGNINPAYASYDSQGNIINDPYPTAFWTGGFDLDAIGVIHSNKKVTINENSTSNIVNIYPNPASSYIQIKINNPLSEELEIKNIQIYNVSGRIVKKLSSSNFQSSIRINISAFENGMYFLKINCLNENLILKFIKD